MSSDRVDATRATYDRIAQEYAQRSGDAGSSPEFVAWRDAVAASAQGPLVDLGCGPGRDLAAFRDAGVSCLGVDLSEGMLGVARQAGLPVVRGDLRRPPLADGGAAVLFCCGALLHVPREDVPATLRAWRAALRPGGVLHLSTSLGGGEGWEAVPYGPGRGPRGGQRLERWFVHHELDPLVAAVRDAGFAVQEATTRTSHREWAQVSARAV